MGFSYTILIVAEAVSFWDYFANFSLDTFNTAIKSTIP